MWSLQVKIKNVHGAPLLLLIISVLLIIAGRVKMPFLSDGGNVYLASAVLQVLILAIPPAIYARARGRKFFSHLRFKLFKAVDIPMMIFALGLMIFGGATISFYIYRVAPEFFRTSASAMMAEGSGDAGTVIYALLSVAILPAITEEFLFRGIVTAEYERNGVALAVVLSSLTFALIHFDLVRIPVYFFNGVILALTLYATRSLFATMTVHAANNILAMFLEVYVYRAAARQGGGIVLFTFICTALTLLFAFLFFSSCSKAYSDLAWINAPSDYAKKKKMPEGGGYVREALTSPFFIILLVVSAIGIILNF